MDASSNLMSEISPLSKEEQKEVKKHLKKVKRQLYRNLLRAYYGWWCWFWVCRTKGFGNTAVVLIPGEDKEISYLSLLYLDQMLNARKHDNAIILTRDSLIMKTASMFSGRILKTQFFNRKKAEALMQFYCLYEFNKKFICASIDEPYGRNGSTLIGKRGTTKEEIFVIGIYRIYPFTRPEKPIYEGDDSAIIEFLKTHDEILKIAEEMKPIAEQYDKEAAARLGQVL